MKKAKVASARHETAGGSKSRAKVPPPSATGLSAGAATKPFLLVEPDSCASGRKAPPHRSSSPATTLRTRAEWLLRQTPREVAQLPTDDVQKLVHELQVNQIELEMQNDELRRTQIELEEARERYVNLYEFAPAAYLALSADGEVLEANLSAGRLLDLERAQLMHRNFTRFIPAEARGSFYPLLRRVFSSDAHQSAELDLVTAQSRRLVVMVEAERDATSPRRRCRLSLTDVTARKRAEAARHESEERLRFALETSHAGAWDLDLADDTAARSIGHDRIFGYGTLLPKWGYKMFLGHVLPEDRAMVDAKFRQAIASQGDWNFECRIRRTDGEVRWIWAAGRHLQDASGARRHMAGFVQDITERKQVEEILHESEERFRSLYENAVVGFYRTTPDGRILMANPALLKMLGFSSLEELVQRNLEQEGFGPDYPRAVFKERIERDGQITGWEAAWKRRDGSILFISENCRVRRDSSGQILFYEGSIEDISERKRAEAALRESEARFQLMATTIEDVLYGVDGTTGEFRYVSPAFERLLGYTLADVAAMGGREKFLARVIQGRGFAAQRHTFHELQAHHLTPAPTRWEAWWRCKNGALRYFEDSWIALYSGDTLTGTYGVLRDITERKRAEEHIAQLSRVQAIRADIDQAIVHLPDRQKLLDEVCRIAVRKGGFKLAWIGMVLPDGSVQPAAKAGATGYLKGIRVVTHDVPEGRGPVGVAIRENRPVVIEDVDRDPRMAPWRDRALQFGLHYVAAFPVRTGDRVTGSFQVYAPRAGFFDENELRLLTQVSNDISFALTAYSELAARKRAEDALRRSEYNLSSFFNHAPIGLEWLSASGCILRANQAQLDLLGYAPEEYLGHFFGEFCTDPAGARELLEQLAADQTVRNLRLPRRRKDGTVRLVLVDAQPLWNEGQFLYSSVFSRDITDRTNLEREILDISERERRRIAQDLHDGLGQLLVGTVYLGSTLRKDLAARSLPEVRQMDRLLRVLDEAIGQTRNLARGLHPVKSEPNGLTVALNDLASQTRVLFQVQCRFICRQPVLIEDPVVATHLYRIAQEAVTNAIKHGKPGRVQISLTRTPARVNLMVRDNGVGLPARPRKHRGMGLRIMQYRAGVIGGSLAIQKETDGGTTVVCSVHKPAEDPTQRPARATQEKD
jgi:two-component system, LuxR family, sensor kinase FixL